MSRYDELVQILLRSETIEDDNLLVEIARAMDGADARIRQLQQENLELLAFARRDGPLFRHKNDTLYQEFEREFADRDYAEGEFVAPYGIATDDIRRGEEFVRYRNAKNEFFARPARLFDEPERFKELR